VALALDTAPMVAAAMFDARESMENAMNSLQRAGALALVLALTPAAWSAGHKAMSDAQQRYQQERAGCAGGKSQQDRATCLKEAAAAYREARRGGLTTEGGAQLSQNSSSRCDVQPPEERQACIQRILGAGSVSGSVEGGGVLRATENKRQ
jgi:hypothetical protein